MDLWVQRYDDGAPVRIAIRDGRIAEIEPLPEDDSRVLPVVAPAFVDLQINGWAGQEFCSLDLTIEHVQRIVETQAAFGVVRLCPTVTTHSFETIAHGLRTIAAARRASPLLGRRILGIHLEGPYISPHDGPRGAHPIEHVRSPDWNEFRRFQDAAEGNIRLVTLSPEYPESPDFIRRAVASGVVVSLGHLAADSDQIKAAVDAGATLSTHLGNGCHRELRRHPNYLWDQLAEDRLTATLIADGVHLPPATLKTFVRAKSPARCLLVSDVSGYAGLPPGRRPSMGGEIEILEDGRIVVAGQRQLLAGASRPMGLGVWNLIRLADVSYKDAFECASLRPLEALARWKPLEHPSATRIEIGEPADLVLMEFDTRPGLEMSDRLKVTRTIEAGVEIY
ncbi:MAG TPA: amidohydrolase family protein [Pirellulales bacterium]